MNTSMIIIELNALLEVPVEEISTEEQRLLDRFNMANDSWAFRNKIKLNDYGINLKANFKNHLSEKKVLVVENLKYVKLEVKEKILECFNDMGIQDLIDRETIESLGRLNNGIVYGSPMFVMEVADTLSAENSLLLVNSFYKDCFTDKNLANLMFHRNLHIQFLEPSKGISKEDFEEQYKKL